MYSENYIKKLFVFDIETTSLYCDVDEFKEKCPDQYKAFEFNYNIRKKTDETFIEYYNKMSRILPEYAKIICISYGSIKDIKTNEYTIRSICEQDERELLVRLAEVFKKVSEKGYLLAGHNVKGFDIPFLIRRYLINKLPVPEILWIGNKKPWELPFVDTKEIYQAGAWDLKTSLYEIAVAMGLYNCKEDMSGEDVYSVFCNDEDWQEKISKYCEGDVRTTMDLLTRFCGEYYEDL